jgi:hypothetical protein
MTNEDAVSYKKCHFAGKLFLLTALRLLNKAWRDVNFAGKENASLNPTNHRKIYDIFTPSLHRTKSTGSMWLVWSYLRFVVFIPLSTQAAIAGKRRFRAVIVGE